MRLRPLTRSIDVALGLALLGAGAAQAQPSPGIVDVGYGEARLSNQYPAWRSAHARITLSRAGDGIYRFEAVHRRAFDDAGLFLGSAVTQQLNTAWYGALNAGTSVGGFFFPRAVVGATIARKWRPRRQLVTTSSLNYFVHKDPHRDLLWSGSAVYYFTRPAVVETGLTIGRSQPGSAISASPFVAGSIGDPRRRTLHARLSAGREAYTRLGVDTALVAFESHVVTMGWRQVVTGESGFVMELEHYGNVAYRRTGVSVGAFFGVGR